MHLLISYWLINITTKIKFRRPKKSRLFYNILLNQRYNYTLFFILQRLYINRSITRDMKLKYIIIFLVFICNCSFAQQSFKHKVVKGESVYTIAKKYDVLESEILALNPQAKGLLQLDMELRIPKKSKKKELEKKKFVPKGPSHMIAPGESLSTIADKYNISIEKLRDANPHIVNDQIQMGELLALPKGIKKEIPKKEDKKEEKKEVKKLSQKQDKVTTKYIILPGESFYVIAKKYQITIDELRTANPQIVNDQIKAGDELILPIAKEIKSKVELPKQNLDAKTKLENKEKKESIVKPQIETVSKGSVVDSKIEKATITTVQTSVYEDCDILITTHLVAPKETKFGISKKYGLTVKELDALNPTILNLIPGEVLVIKKKQLSEIVGPNPIDSENLAIITPVNYIPVPPMDAAAEEKANYLIAKASDYIGIRYRSGGTDPKGFDCSGFMFFMFNHIEMKLPHSSQDQATLGVRIDPSQAQKGDLIFFKTTRRGIGHVGMITEINGDEIKFIHSSTNSGIVISSTKEGYYAKRFVQINRVL